MTQAEFNQMLQTAIAGGSVGGYYTSKWSGEEIDKRLDEIAESGYAPASNPNLLDNWYFPDPINQRGKSEYIGGGYTIDRWKNLNNRVVTTLKPNGLTVSRNPEFNPDYTLSVVQSIENIIPLLGRTLTLSALVAECEINPRLTLFDSVAVGTISPNPQLITVTSVIPSPATSLTASIGVNAGGTNENVVYTAAKLELGPEQTLAHQDDSGSWVLNDPPPNKTLELMKCQRYQIQFVNPVNPNENSYGMVGFGSAVSATRCSIMIPTPCPINRSGTIVYTGNLRLFSGENKLWANGIAVTNIMSDYCPSNGVCLWVDVASGLTAGKSYYLAYAPTGNGAKNSLIYDMNL